MNDFANEIDVLFLEDTASGVGEVDGAFYSVAKAELLREADGGVVNGEGATEFFSFSTTEER